MAEAAADGDDWRRVARGGGRQEGRVRQATRSGVSKRVSCSELVGAPSGAWQEALVVGRVKRSCCSATGILQAITCLLISPPGFAFQ